MKRFEEIKIGDCTELKHLISKEDVEKFVLLTGDDNRLHIDKEFAKNTSFKKPVAHGMLTASFISTIIGTKIPGDGALWYSQSLEFLLPVRVGDEITVKAEVTKKFEKLNSIELATNVFNQNREKVISGFAQVKIIEKEIELKNEAEIPYKAKVALIIGATGGIGQCAALELANDGYDVAIHYNTNAKLASEILDKVEKNGGRGIIVQGDITNTNDVNNIIEKVVRFFDNISVLVNCSTTSVPPIKFNDLEWLDIQNQININILGFFNVLKKVIPIMEKNGYGKIIGMTTVYTEKLPVNLTHYVAAKSSLNGFIKSLANEFAPKGIRINLISPGITETDLISNMPEKLKLLTAAQTPLRRIATPKDIAGVISFLASEKSDYLAGETIRVNGGQVMI
jgi:3-oxoacyl-[acyl-carrier protein] reductase